MFTISDSITEIQKEIASQTEASARRIEGLWGVDCLFNPAGNGRIFNYKFILAQTHSLGCAYSLEKDYPAEELEKLVGKDFLTLDINDMALRVALLDSMYPACAKMKPVLKETAEGSSVEKMRWRSLLILKEAERLLGGVKGKRIVNVGVVGDILTTFADSGADIVGTDFDETITGKKMFDRVEIIHGMHTQEVIAESELCIVTGMTITTGTIDGIISLCREKNVKMIVFAETGANLGGYYVRQGVDSYLGEIFPFYIFSGTSRIDIYRSK